jgi:SAM-dependent methyltransferase
VSDYPAPLYAAVHDGNPGDIEFYRRRCEGARTIVELGCGDARVLAALAGPGRRLIGVDIDPELLTLAQARFDQFEPFDRGGSSESALSLICADMRAVELDPSWVPVDRVIIPYGGLYCLLEPAAVEATLARVANMLAPDGFLILDAWAADGFHAEADPEDQDPTWLERVKAVEIDGHRWEVLERSRWDKDNQRIDATYLHFRVGDETPIEGALPQRYVLAEQLRASLSAAGLELVELHGDFAGAAYGPDAELMVAVARRA